MSRNIKRIIALALVVGTVSAIAPASNVNLLTTKAYAATNEDNELTELKLKTSSGSSIKLYNDNDYKSSHKVDSDEVEAGETYYAKTTSDKITFSVKGPNSKYVRVFTSSSSSAKGKKVSSDFSLSDSTTTTFTIKVYGEAPGSTVKNSEDDDYELLNTYKVKVKFTGTDSSSDSESDTSASASDYDKIYLDKLSVNGSSITLAKSKIDYAYNVASDVSKVTIKAVPEDEDEQTVEINGSEVDSSDKYKKDVTLKNGENKIKIELTSDDNEERIYTLTVTRGTATGTGSSTDGNTTVPKSKWVMVNGQWQYNDAIGNPAKNTWVQNYYLKADGNMATEWLNINGNMYYFGADGAKRVGWQKINGLWYYLDTAEGKMKTGWMKDLDGKYYYLNSNGAMAFNTTINGYKLGPSGAWIR